MRRVFCVAVLAGVIFLGGTTEGGIFGGGVLRNDGGLPGGRGRERGREREGEREGGGERCCLGEMEKVES